MIEEFGTPTHMLRRNDAPDTSYAAALHVDTTKMEAIVFEGIKNFTQERGCTSFDISEIIGIPHYRVAPRIKGLEQHGYIYYRGDTRKGATNRQMRIIRLERRKKERIVLQHQDEFRLVGGA